MMQIMQQIQQQWQEYDERNECRMTSLTEEMASLTVCMGDFHEIIHHVGVTGYEGRGRAQGRGLE